jgi:opacity protein-like surface antigen
MFTTLFVLSCISVNLAQDDSHKFEVSGGYSFERTKGFSGDTLTSTSSFGTGITGADRNHNLNGFSASAVYNFSKYLGAKFEFSGNYGSDTNPNFPFGNYRQANGITILVIPGSGASKASQRDYKYLGGLQFKDNSTENRIKPFARALFGSARQTTNFPNIDQQRANLIGGRTIKTNSFSMAYGGGLDIRVSKRIDIRVIQFDYNPTFIKEKTLVALGASVDTTLVNLSGGNGSSVVTTLQDVRVPKHTEHNFRIGFGIVFH